MQINLTGHKLRITDALREYTIEKLKKLQRHSSHISQINIVMKVEKPGQTVEASVRLDNTDFHPHATATTADMYTTVDSLVVKLDKQLVKHKQKHRNH